VIQPEPPGLLMAMVQNGPTQMVSGNIFEGLLRYSPKLEPLPALAESWPGQSARAVTPRAANTWEPRLGDATPLGASPARLRQQEVRIVQRTVEIREVYDHIGRVHHAVAVDIDIQHVVARADIL